MKSDAEKAGELFEETAKILKIPIDKLHLLNYEEYKEFETKFIEKLKENDIDLSFRTQRCEKFNINIGGNALGINSDFKWNFVQKQWIPTEMTEQERNEWGKKYPNAKLYTIDTCGNVYECKKKLLKETKFTNETKTIGTGSSQVVYEKGKKLYTDKFHNLRIESYTLPLS